jgi:hypothetical protein
MIHCCNCRARYYLAQPKRLGKDTRKGEGRQQGVS